MPKLGKCWYHITFTTYNSWLPGDPRGFRSRAHKLHSSGNHRNPPPKGEHAGLYHHAKSISGEAVLLDQAVRAVTGQAIVTSMRKHEHTVLVVAVSGQHVHVLAQLPASRADTKKAVGNAKLSASMKLKGRLPGRAWAKGCSLKPIRDEQHQRNTFAYFQKHADEGAWAWTFRDEPPG